MSDGRPAGAPGGGAVTGGTAGRAAGPERGAGVAGRAAPGGSGGGAEPGHGAAVGAGLDLLVELAPRGSRRRALEEALRTGIREGRLPPGTRLPATRDLARELGVARGTVSQAYAQLTAEGWLTARTRSGTRVADGAASDPRPAGPAARPVPAVRHDLHPGRPDIAAFPRAAWARALRQVVQQAPAEVFGYGDPRGRPELRRALAAYLGRVRGVRVDPGHLLVCSGYTQALGLLCEVFAGVGAGAAAMEDPAMPEHVAVAAKWLAVVDAPVDEQGMRMDGLGAAQVVICTPAHQFPLGVSMSPQRRARLLAWARECGGWIVEDDYDGEFRYDRRPIGALQSRLPSRIAYVGSTSKSLGPAVRLGWVVCPPPLLEPLVEVKRLADRQTSPVEQLALAELVTGGGYDRHLRAMRQAYRRRRDALVAAVDGRLPQARITGIAAGLHAIVELPAAVGGERQVAGALRAASVQVQTLGHYARGTVGAPAALVVGYATPPGHGYAAALDALLGVLVGRCA
jgi:GntR family transcriptional regulator / MocR family aminotransferase